MATGMPRLPHPKARSRVKAAVILLTALGGLLHIPALFTPVYFRPNPANVAQRGALLSRAALAGEEDAQFKEFAQRAGPPAVKKMQKFVELVNECGDVFPTRVKLHFQAEGESCAEDPLIWSPRQQHLHEIFLDFEHIVYDFNLKYRDQDDEQVLLRPSKGAVEAMVESMAGKPVRMAVIWRPPNPTEWANREATESRASTPEAVKTATQWLTGGGKASAEAVSEAEKRVEKCGGRIVPNKDKVALVRYRGTDLDKWPEVCGNLQKELKLSEDEVATLKNAEYTDECMAFVSHEFPDGPVHTTRVVAYRTVRDVPNKKIHVVYGRHESSMQAASQALDFPLTNCIKLGDRTFTVLPPASPHFKHSGTDMENNPFAIPAGWVPVKTSDPAFTSILHGVVAPYYWGTSVLALESGDGAWTGFRTANCGPRDRGTPWDNVPSLKPQGGSLYVFTGCGVRLLVEAVPTKSAEELIRSWQRFVQLSAQADWGHRLALRRSRCASA